jgi:hypothetical protein
MSLPWLTKEKGSGGISIDVRKPDENSDKNQGDESGLLSCADDLLTAFHNKDKKLLASALRAAFDIMDSEPHVEGPHLNSEQDENE